MAVFWHAVHARLEYLVEVIARIVEWLLQRLPQGAGDQTFDLEITSRTFSEMRKWKKTLSGQSACWRTEWMAAMEPCRYSTSSVITMWKRDMSQTVVGEEEGETHSIAFWIGGAVRKVEERVTGNPWSG